MFGLVKAHGKIFCGICAQGHVPLWYSMETIADSDAGQPLGEGSLELMRQATGPLERFMDDGCLAAASATYAALREDDDRAFVRGYFRAVHTAGSGMSIADIGQLGGISLARAKLSAANQDVWAAIADLTQRYCEQVDVEGALALKILTRQALIDVRDGRVQHDTIKPSTLKLLEKAEQRFIGYVRRRHDWVRAKADDESAAVSAEGPNGVRLTAAVKGHDAAGRAEAMLGRLRANQDVLLEAAKQQLEGKAAALAAEADGPPGANDKGPPAR